MVLNLNSVNELSSGLVIKMDNNMQNTEVRQQAVIESSDNYRLPQDNVTDVYGLPIIANKMDASFTFRKVERNISTMYGANSSISYILPSVDDNIISAIVLSKWDDIMGPQTIHVWVKSKAGMNNTVLAKAVKYVTSHTVNYSGLNSSLSPDSIKITTQKNGDIFIVPELDLVAQSLKFQLHNVPHSLAVAVEYCNYKHFLHLRQLCLHLLQRVTARLHAILSKCDVFEVDDVNGWMLDACEMLMSLKTCGLVPTTGIQPLHVLDHSLLERVLTSHLQTFGCTVVVGTSPEDINSLIFFLAHFLDADELHCSRCVLPPGTCSFHAGLFLQGLLLNEFGCRELCSVELATNPHPVTAVDLTRGAQSSAVKQTPLRRLRSTLQDEPCGRGLHENDEKPGCRKYLAKALDLEDSDLLIVLAVAEKLRPGIHALVVGDSPVSR